MKENTLILQKMIYPSVGSCEELYYRSQKCHIDGEEKCVYMDSVDSYIDFSSYFNMLSYEKWNKYTACNRFGMCISVMGTVSLVVKNVYFDNDKAVTVELSKTILSSPINKRFEISFDYISRGFYTVSILCLKEETEVKDIAYISIDDSLPGRDITLGLCICTYRRETEALRNLRFIEEKILNNPSSSMNGHVKVFISDNASTLDEVKLQTISIFHNKNYGGSGGFTRAIIEAMESDVTHFVLMDDDISFEIGVIERTYTFLKLLKPKYFKSFIGASMLISDRQYMQHAAGETDDLIGIHFDKRDYVLSNIDFVVKNEIDMKSNYLGWWYMAMPRCAIEENGYSYPMFVQYDDIEFSIRNAEYEKINVNGIAVWHDDFEQKKSAVKVYYTIRNRLISHSLCYGRFLLIRRFGECVLKSYGRLRRGYYYEARLILLAGFDYLKGPDYICQLDMEQKNKDLYEYARREDCPGKMYSWLVIIGLWIKLFAELLVNRKRVINQYRESADYYTSKEYWSEKLGI